MSCPHCGDINIVPDDSAVPETVRVAEVVNIDRPMDRAEEAGYPPDSGPEQTVMNLRPCMWRAHPFLTVFTLGIGTFVLYLKHLGQRIEITNKRTLYRTGFLSKSTSEVLHDHVRNITIDQGFINRMFRVGQLGIASSGQEGIEIEAHCIPNPDEIKRIIDLYRPM